MGIERKFSCVDTDGTRSGIRRVQSEAIMRSKHHSHLDIQLQRRNVDITCKAAPSNVYVHLLTMQRLHATHERRRRCLHIKGNGLRTGFCVIIGYFTALLLLSSIYEDEWSGNEWWICTDLERDRHGQVRLEIRTPKASIMIINNVCDMWPGYLAGCITAFWASCKRWECVTGSVPAIRSRGKGPKSELFNTFSSLYGDASQITSFRVITPCTISLFWTFGGECCLHLQGDLIRFGSRSDWES